MKILLSLLALLCAIVPARAAEPERLIMLHQWGEWLPTVDAARTFAEQAKAHGFTGAGLAIPWNKIEPQASKYDFTWLDERLDVFVQAGLRVHLRFEAGRIHTPDWLTCEWMRTRDGKVFEAAGNFKTPYHILSLADEAFVGPYERALGAVVAHVWPRYADRKPFPIVSIHPVWTTCAESEYPNEAMTDFGPLMQTDFRRWARTHHGTLDVLNKRWGKLYATWDAITLQEAPAFDFQAHRTEVLGVLLDRLGAAVHRTPGAVFNMQFGSIWDGISMNRGSYDITRLARRADSVAVDDALSYDVLFSYDYLRGQIPGRTLAGETGGPWDYPAINTRVPEFARQMFSRGGSVLYVANLIGDMIPDPKLTFWSDLQAAGRESYPFPQPKKAILVSLATLYQLPYGQAVRDVVLPDYMNLSKQETEPVDFISDTLLREKPELIKQYTEGIWVPDGMKWMTDELVGNIGKITLPVHWDHAKAGRLDEYGKERPAPVK